MSDQGDTPRQRTVTWHDPTITATAFHDLTGLEFLRRIRRHKHLFDTPVVLFTAHAAQVDIVRGLQAGADGYIAKPIAASALVAAVRTVLGH